MKIKIKRGREGNRTWHATRRYAMAGVFCCIQPRHNAKVYRGNQVPLSSTFIITVKK